MRASVAEADSALEALLGTFLPDAKKCDGDEHKPRRARRTLSRRAVKVVLAGLLALALLFTLHRAAARQATRWTGGQRLRVALHRAGESVRLAAPLAGRGHPAVQRHGAVAQVSLTAHPWTWWPNPPGVTMLSAGRRCRVHLTRRVVAERLKTKGSWHRRGAAAGVGSACYCR